MLMLTELEEYAGTSESCAVTSRKSPAAGTVEPHQCGSRYAIPNTKAGV